MIGPATPVSAPLVPAQSGGNLRKVAQVPAQSGGNLRKVAQGFEAMLLRQVLSAAGKTSFGGEELFGSSSDKTFTEMRDARFAELAASSGTLGLAAQIEAQLSRQIGAD